MLPFLPRWPVMLNLWFADDEFDGSARLLVDKSADHYLSIEDAVTVADIVIAAWRKTAASSNPFILCKKEVYLMSHSRDAILESSTASTHLKPPASHRNRTRPRRRPRRQQPHPHHLFLSPYSPTAAVWFARQAGLCTCGLMDHDTIAGAEEFLAAAEAAGMAATMGMEFRVSFANTPFAGKMFNNPTSPA